MIDEDSQETDLLAKHRRLMGLPDDRHRPRIIYSLRGQLSGPVFDDDMVVGLPFQPMEIITEGKKEGKNEKT